MLISQVKNSIQTTACVLLATSALMAGFEITPSVDYHHTTMIIKLDSTSEYRALLASQLEGEPTAEIDLVNVLIETLKVSGKSNQFRPSITLGYHLNQDLWGLNVMPFVQWTPKIKMSHMKLSTGLTAEQIQMSSVPFNDYETGSIRQQQYGLKVFQTMTKQAKMNYQMAMVLGRTSIDPNENNHISLNYTGRLKGLSVGMNLDHQWWSKLTSRHGLSYSRSTSKHYSEVDEFNEKVKITDVVIGSGVVIKL